MENIFFFFFFFFIIFLFYYVYIIYIKITEVFPELCVTQVVEPIEINNNEIDNVISLNLNPPSLCKKNSINNKNEKNFNTKDKNSNDEKKVILNNMNDTLTTFLKPIRDNKWKIIFGLLIIYLIVLKVLTRMEIKIVSSS